MSVTIKTRDDSASLAFIEAERLYFDDKNPVAAVNQFYKVAKKYADIKEVAVNGIYAAAWMCDNVLNKNKKAFMLYKKLCDDYPESELCINEAKPRIKIVEDTLKILETQEKQKEPKKHIKKKKTVKKKTEDKDTSTIGKEEDLLEPGEIDTTLEDKSKVIETDTTTKKVDEVKVKEVQIELKEEKIEEEQ